MKLMTYNILDGGKDRLGLIISVIKSESLDILVINEANDFKNNEDKFAKRFSTEIDLPNYAIASTEWGYDVAIFSKIPFTKSEVLMPNKRAALSFEIDSEFGPISIVGTHLSPDSEAVRVAEIGLIMRSHENSENRIIMGDMNALSRRDNYSFSVVNGFNDKQLKKFTRDGKPLFDVTDTIYKVGYHDAAVHMNKNKETTVPTPSNKDKAHANLRLDYVFLSESLLTHLIDYKVVKNEITDKASDHYPVVTTLK
jgi:exodeoxyribonuclease-3